MLVPRISPLDSRQFDRIMRLFALKGQVHVSPGQSETAPPCSAALGLIAHEYQALQGQHNPRNSAALSGLNTC